MNRTAVALIFASSMVVPTANAGAAEFIYSSGLSGLQESPVVITPGTGLTTVTYDNALHTLRVQIAFSDLIGTTTASHIHIRPVFMDNGPVATQTPFFAGFPIGVTSGSYDNTFNLVMASSWNPAFVTANGGIAQSEAALFSGLQDGRAYLNVHSSFKPGGEIRGNLAAVPEAGTWAMILVGFFGIGGAMRRRLAIPQESVS